MIAICPAAATGGKRAHHMLESCAALQEAVASHPAGDAAPRCDIAVVTVTTVRPFCEAATRMHLDTARLTGTARSTTDPGTGSLRHASLRMVVQCRVHAPLRWTRSAGGPAPRPVVGGLPCPPEDHPMTHPIQRSATPSPNVSRQPSPVPAEAEPARQAPRRLVAAELGPPGLPPQRVPAAAGVADAATAARTLDTLPDGLLQAVAGHLPPADRLQLGGVSRTAARALDPEVRAARVVTSHAPDVADAARFQAVLGPGDPRSVAALPPHVQAEALVALAGRFMALPGDDRQQAIAAFRAFEYRGEPHAVLSDVQRAARDGTVGLRRREAALVGHGGAAAVAVGRGENIQEVARRLAISGPHAIDTLEGLAMGRAHQALAGGESVPAAAARLGISTPPRLADLERHAAMHLGIAAVGGGEAPAVVAARLGIHNPVYTGVLNHSAARRDVEQGRPVDAALREFNVTSRDAALGLELHAAETAGAAALQRGQNVREAAAQLGIHAATALARLERLAVDSVGAAAVRQGETAAAVALRLDIREQANLDRLAEHAGAQPPAKRARLD